MKEKILNEIIKGCNECLSKEKCPEERCVLFRIQEILIKKKCSDEK